MAKVMRESKHGGFSLCASPPDKVGKGRCHHILNEGDDLILNYNKEDRCYYLDLKDTLNEYVPIKVKTELVTKIMQEISKSISEEEKVKILKHLKNIR